MLRNIFFSLSRDFISRTSTLFISLSFLLVVSGTARANDVLKDFTFTTINGRTFDADTLNDSPMVVNIMAHW